MSELILIRHGQANSQATDEAAYDQLSELGHQQARWLGEYLRATGAHFDRVLTGTLTRQMETATAMALDVTAQDTRLNELRYFEITQAVERRFGTPAPESAQEFARYLPQVITHWSQDMLHDVPETYAHFSGRIRALIDELCAQGGRSLLVTSGGVISMILTHVLGLNITATAHLMLQVRNTSIHSVRYVHDTLMLAGFNATPHLDIPERIHARTYV